MSEPPVYAALSQVSLLGEEIERHTVEHPHNEKTSLSVVGRLDWDGESLACECTLTSDPSGVVTTEAMYGVVPGGCSSDEAI